MREAGHLGVGRLDGEDDAPDRGAAPADLRLDGEALGTDVDAAGHHGLDEAGRRRVDEDVAAARRQAGDAVTAVLADAGAVAWTAATCGPAGPDAGTGTWSRMSPGPQADDGRRRGDLDGLLLAEALDDGLAGLDALARDHEGAIGEMEREAQQTSALGAPDRDHEAGRLGPGADRWSVIGRCPPRPAPPSAPAGRGAARRCRATPGGWRACR